MPSDVCGMCFALRILRNGSNKKLGRIGTEARHAMEHAAFICTKV